jgi:hypothetical protein
LFHDINKLYNLALIKIRKICLMNKRILLSLSIAGFIFVTCTGQGEVGAQIKNFHNAFKMSNNEFKTAKDLDYDGTPYLEKEFLPGAITTPDNVKYIGVDIRYNIYSDNFEFNQDGVAMSLEKSSRWPKFEVNDQLFEYKPYSYKSASTKGYLETLVDGKYSLHLKYTVVLKEAEEPGAYSEATKALFYSLRPETMIGNDGKEIIIVLNAKDLLREFPETESLVSDYSKGKKLKLKKKDDFIALVEYLNSLSK